MEIILLENILNLGNIGDKVKVKNGYGRNYLLRQGKALRFNKENLSFVERKKDELKDNLKPIHGPGAQRDENVVHNKVIKWTRMLGEDRSIRCKSKKDFKTVDMFEMCIWNCQIYNPNIYDEAMYVGRIQINMNDGKKRKFLYFQSDYKIKNVYSDFIPSEGDRDDDELEGFGG